MLCRSVIGKAGVKDPQPRDGLVACRTWYSNKKQLYSDDLLTHVRPDENPLIVWYAAHQNRVALHGSCTFFSKLFLVAL